MCGGDVSDAGKAGGESRDAGRLPRSLLADGETGAEEPDIETVIHVSLVSHQMISYAREAVAGKQGASFYHAAERQRSRA